MSAQYQRNRLDHFNALDNENQHQMMKARRHENGSSTSRVPLRSKQLNTEYAAYNGGPKTNAPSDAKPSSRASKPKPVEEEPPIEIEELRRKSNGEGHTVHKYIRGKMLGKGGFAKVYMCTSMDTNRTYAVKIVPKANLKKARARQKVNFFEFFDFFTCHLD